jgi:putative methyltransferase (TIGR04325 family)
MNFKRIVKTYVPSPVLRFITGFFYGWRGNYKSWNEARNKSGGYDSPVILEKVLAATQLVMDGKATYERDSVLFYDQNYSYPCLAAIMWISVKNKGKINIIDFGGSLGSAYFQNRVFFDSLQEINWCVIEQEKFVETGKQKIANNHLHFFSSIEECLKSFKIDLIIFSSVLQYLENPYSFLDEVLSMGFEYVLIDRTPFVDASDRITIQKVPKRIYKASYPCWFFNKRKFKKFFDSMYGLIYEFDAHDKANINSEFKGFLFKKK